MFLPCNFEHMSRKKNYSNQRTWRQDFANTSLCNFRQKRKGCTVKMDTIRCPITSAIEHPICITTLAMKMRYNFTLHDRVIKFQCCVEVIKKKKVTLLWNCVPLNVILLFIKPHLFLPQSNNVFLYILTLVRFLLIWDNESMNWINKLHLETFYFQDFMSYKQFMIG